MSSEEKETDRSRVGCRGIGRGDARGKKVAIGRGRGNAEKRKGVGEKMEDGGGWRGFLVRSRSFLRPRRRPTADL